MPVKNEKASLKAILSYSWKDIEDIDIIKLLLFPYSSNILY